MTKASSLVTDTESAVETSSTTAILEWRPESGRVDRNARYAIRIARWSVCDVSHHPYHMFTGTSSPLIRVQAHIRVLVDFPIEPSIGALFAVDQTIAVIIHEKVGSC